MDKCSINYKSHTLHYFEGWLTFITKYNQLKYVWLESNAQTNGSDLKYCGKILWIDTSEGYGLKEHPIELYKNFFWKNDTI